MSARRVHLTKAHYTAVRLLAIERGCTDDQAAAELISEALDARRTRDQFSAAVRRFARRGPQ